MRHPAAFATLAALAGLALAVSWISSAHAAYLDKGGIDGFHPAHNADRGPVAGARLHAEF